MMEKKENAAGVGSTDSEVEKGIGNILELILDQNEKKVNFPEVIHFQFQWNEIEIVSHMSKVEASPASMCKAIYLMAEMLQGRIHKSVAEEIARRFNNLRPRNGGRT